MIILYIFGILVLLLILFYLGAFLFTFGRQKVVNRADPRFPKNHYLYPYHRLFIEGERWADETPHEDVSVTSHDGLTLRGRYYPVPDSKRTLLLFHGYRGWDSNDFSGATGLYHRLGFNILLVQQRAHRNSGGFLVTFGVKERYDVLSWCNYINTRTPGHKLILDGISMGAATVLMAAGLDLPVNVVGLIADSSYTEPAQIIGKVIRTMHLPPRPILWGMNILCHLFGGFGLYDASTTEAMEKSTLPVLLIHGKNDRLVPYEMTVQAAEACGDRCTLILVDGADHGLSYCIDHARVEAGLREFLEKVDL